MARAILPVTTCILLSFAMLVPTATAYEDESPLLPTGMPPLSPDGVHILDTRDHSAVWGRGFQLDLPPDQDAWSLHRECDRAAREAGGPEPTLTECLRPWTTLVYWTDQRGDPVHDAVDDVLEPPTTPSAHNTRDVRLEVGDFTINDNIDGCCGLANRDGEPYVIFHYEDENGIGQSAQRTCNDQGTSSGDCDQFVEVPALKESVQGCSGHRFEVQFWDDDGSSDDLMDISIELGRAEVQVEVTTGSCAERWWGDRLSDDSPDEHHCHGVETLHSGESVGSTFCPLTGQHDTSGDNDDATLEFTVSDVENDPTAPPPPLPPLPPGGSLLARNFPAYGERVQFPPGGAGFVDTADPDNTCLALLSSTVTTDAVVAFYYQFGRTLVVGAEAAPNAGVNQDLGSTPADDCFNSASGGLISSANPGSDLVVGDVVAGAGGGVNSFNLLGATHVADLTTVGYEYRLCEPLGTVNTGEPLSAEAVVCGADFSAFPADRTTPAYSTGTGFLDRDNFAFLHRAMNTHVHGHSVVEFCVSADLFDTTTGLTTAASDRDHVLALTAAGTNTVAALAFASDANNLSALTATGC